MSSPLQVKHWLIICIPVAIAVTAIAWSGGGNPIQQNDQPKQDTVPVSKNRPHHKAIKDKDLDVELKDIDKAIEDLDGKTVNIDWDNLEKELEKSLSKADQEMEHIDMEKIGRDVEASINEIDFGKIAKETDKAMQQVEKNTDFTTIAAQVKKSMEEVKRQINSETFRKNLEAAKDAGKISIREALENARMALDKNKIDLKVEIDKAREVIKKSKETLQAYQEMLQDMEERGLIDTKKDYSIDYKNGDLYINDQKQTQEITDKYSHYFKNDNTRLYKKDGSMHITN